MSEIEEILKLMGEENAKKFDEARQKLAEDKAKQRARQQEMRDIDEQLTKERVQKEMDEKSKAKSEDARLDEAILLLSQLLAERRGEEKGKHGSIDIVT